MEAENKKIYLTPTRQILLTLNVIKGTVAIEDFQIGLGDGTPKDGLDPFEVTNELARVNLDAMEWKIIEKNKIYELKIKIPDVCAKKVKEIGLYYSEKPQDAQNNSTLIAYSYQAQTRHEDKGEELTLQLVLPHSKEEEMEHPNDSSNSVTIGESRLINPAPSSAASLSDPVLCYVRDEAANRCLISSKKVRNVHQNGYGRYELWIDSIDKDQIVIGTSFPGWRDKYFNVPKGHILVAGNGAWYNANSWRIRKEISQIVTVEEDAKDLEQRLKELEEKLTGGKNGNKKDLEQKLKELLEELKGGKDDDKKDFGQIPKELLEKLKDGKDDNKKDFGKMLKELVEELKGGKDDNKKDFGQMLKELVEELKGGKDDNKKDFGQMLKELEKRLNELEEKQAKQFRDINNANSCCCCCCC